MFYIQNPASKVDVERLREKVFVKIMNSEAMDFHKYEWIEFTGILNRLQKVQSCKHACALIIWIYKLLFTYLR